MMGCVLAEGEAYDSPRALAQAGPFPAVGPHWMVEDGEAAEVPPALRALVAAYRKLYLSYEPQEARYLTLHRGHMMFVRPDERQFINAELIKNLTLTGTLNDIRERVEAFAAAGYDQLMVQLVPGQEQALEEWARAFNLRTPVRAD